MARERARSWGRLLVAIVGAVAVATAIVALLEEVPGVPNASNVYLVAVAVIAIGFGIAGAAATAVVSVLTYDLLFTEPRFALTVSDPDEWLHLVLLLFVAVTVGELAALQRARAEAAVARERESRALFDVTRTLATRDSTVGSLPAIARALAAETHLPLVWFALGPDDGTERVVAQSDPRPIPPAPRGYAILHPGEAGGSWRQVRVTAGGPSRAPGAGETRLRVRLAQGGRTMGSLWALRAAGEELPDPPTTALLRVAADLVAQALAHDRLEDEARQAEIARQSDALKSSLLESVSHDLRTPLASIRASAGTLMDPDLRLAPDDVRSSAVAIDREAQRLNRLVGNLLDLSRIEAGALRTAPEALDVEDVVARAISLVEGRAGIRRIEFTATDDLAVLADPILLEEALLNLLENAIRHTPEGSVVRVAASSAPEPEVGGLEGDRPAADLPPRVLLTVEDSGPGVADAQLGRIFDKFFRARPGRRSTGTGMGIGLAVVRGFVEAMGGTVAARRSVLGGLAVDVELPAASTPAAVEDAV